MRNVSASPWWLYVWCLFALLPLGWVPLFDVDEGAFSEATREMMQSGNYLTTYLYGLPRFDKPVAIYWLQAISAYIFGLNTWAMRLPSAVAATVWLYGIYGFVRRYYGEAVAYTAVWMFVGSLQINLIAKSAIADALLNMAVSGAMLSWWQYIEHKQKQDLLVGYCLIGLGILTKGPIAIIIPVLALGTYALTKKSVGFLYDMMVYPWGWIGLLSICMPWYIAELYDQGWAFVEGFFWQHNMHRALSVMETHSGGYGYYIPVILLGLMPFSAYLGCVAASWRRLWTCERERFLLCWALSVFGFFTIVSTKLPHYVLYGYTPCIILMAVYGKNWWSDRRFLLGPALGLTVLLSALPWIFAYVMTVSQDNLLQAVAPRVVSLFKIEYQLLLWGSMVLLVGGLSWSGWQSYRPMLLAVWSCWLLHFLLMPRVAVVLQDPIYEAAMLVKERDYKVTMYRMHTPSFAFYSARIPARRPPLPGDVVLTRSWYLSDFTDYSILYNQGGVVLVRLADDH